MKNISIVTVIIGALLTFVGVMPLFIPKMLSTEKSIGIIGGAESEITEQVIQQLRFNLWQSSHYPVFIILGVAIIILGIVLLIIKFIK